MTDVINLAKEKAEKVTISLAKKGLSKFPTMRVGADIDVSGSMSGLFQRGVVEKVFERLIGYGLTFDDNGEIDCWAFDNRVYDLPTAKPGDFGSYITRNVTKNWSRYGGGTNYAPPIKANLDHFFPAQKGGLASMFSKKAMSSNDPVVILFFTDGDAYDDREAGALMGQAEKEGKPIYFHLIGIGTATRFEKLRRLADDYDNCGFLHLPSIEITDEQLYDAMATEEFVGFLKKHGAA